MIHDHGSALQRWGVHAPRVHRLAPRRAGGALAGAGAAGRPSFTFLGLFGEGAEKDTRGACAPPRLGAIE